MTGPQPRVQIHILTPEDEDDADLTDLGLVNIGGERHLFLKPQSFDSAVRQVSSAMPDLPLEQVERLVREHSEFKDFDELLGAVEPASPLDITPMHDAPLKHVRLRGRARRWVIAAALAPALAGSWALGYITAGSPAGTTASAPDTSPSPSSTDASVAQPAVKPFVGPEFLDFSEAGQIDCKPIANLEAECTDADGMVMSSKAATGPDSTIFTFSYGSERIGLRIFGDADYAETWAHQDGTTELYPNLSRSGRYVLWGTDKERLSEYMELLRAAESYSSSTPHAMGSASPLPPRLAALTLGTLGLDEHDVETILYSPRSARVDEPVLLAAQAVLGVQTPGPRFTGGDDIVAIAAGVDQQPVVSLPEHTTDIDPPAVPISTEGTQPATASPAPAPEPAAEAPQVEQPAPTPAPVEATAPEQTTPTPVVVEEEPPEQVSEPPAEEAPTVPPEQSTPPVEETPVEETSAPVETPAEEMPAAPPMEGIPAQGDTPADGAPPPGQSTAPPGHTVDQADAGDDLLILDSAWTVAAA